MTQRKSLSRGSSGANKKEDALLSPRRVEGYLPENVYMAMAYNGENSGSRIQSYEARAEAILKDLTPKIQGTADATTKNK